MRKGHSRPCPSRVRWTERPRRTSREDLIDVAEEFDDVHGFGEISAGAGVEQPSDLSCAGIGRDHQHRNLAGRRVRLQLEEDVAPAHGGKVQVEEQEVRHVLTHEVEARDSLASLPGG